MRYLIILIIATISAAAIYLSLALMLTPAPIPAEYWVREMIVIKKHIAQKYRGQRKIIIASGSAALFDIDAGQLGGELGIPVINFGLHAGLSLKTILEETKSISEQNDIIVLPLEPHYYCINEPTNWQVMNTIAWEPDRWKRLPIIDQIKAITGLNPTIIWVLAAARIQESLLPQSIADRLFAMDDKKILARYYDRSEPIAFAYSAYHLDAFGTMQKTNGSYYVGIPRSPEKKIDICPKSWQLLREFTADMASNNIGVYFANIPYVETKNMNKARVEEVDSIFAKELSQIGSVLDDKHQLIFSRELFYNTDLHLNTEGRRLRTKMLANAIQHNEPFLSRIR